MNAIILLIIVITSSHCTIISESYDYFDPFYYNDLFIDLEQQSYNNKCSLKTGPHCFRLMSFNSLNIPPRITQHINNDKSLNTFKSYFNAKTEEIMIKVRQDPNYKKILQVKKTFEYSLLLTMESYNEITVNHDMNMPHEMVIPYGDFYLHMSFNGIIRLTNDMVPIRNEDEPNMTYGVIEKGDVIISFNKPIVFVHIFIRKHIGEELKNGMASIKGYKNNEIVYMYNEAVNEMNWKKIVFEEKLIDSIYLEKGIDFDNMKIIYKSLLDLESEENQDEKYQYKMQNIFARNKQKINQTEYGIANEMIDDYGEADE